MSKLNHSFSNKSYKYRINMAMELLRSTNIEVREIAFMVGFSDLPHFIKTFKKHTGKTPSKYRNSAE